MNISSSVYNKIRTNRFSIKIRVAPVMTTLSFNVMPCTRLNKLIHLIAKKVGIDALKSNIQLYKRLSFHPLLKSSTVQQCQIKPGETIVCKFKAAERSGWSYFAKTHDFETVSEYKKYLPKKYITPGLNLEVMCVNPNCIEYGETKVKPLGTGLFDVNRLFTNTKCHLCPDRKLGTNPPMAVKKVRFVSCYWRYEGKASDESGFERTKFGRGWVKVRDFDEKNFGKLMQGSKWKDLRIAVRGY